MIRLSGIITELKEARLKLTSVNSKADYFIVNGEASDVLYNSTKDSINNCLYSEKYLRLSVSNACMCLDGFDANIMDPIDYISRFDIRNKFVDICKGTQVVATIDLLTGKIIMLNPEHTDNG